MKDSKAIIEKLNKLYPDPKCELNFSTPFELLVSTILSAQATDKKVNEITAVLFKKYNTAHAFASLTEDELTEEIKSINYNRTKAKNLIAMSKMLVEKYNGEVPKAREELVQLAGVGRKTANVVLSNAYNVPAIAVDTHVFRVSNRIGIVNEKDVEKTEIALEKEIPKELWILSHGLFVYHGRRICDAKKPKCEICPISDVCDYFAKASE